MEINMCVGKILKRIAFEITFFFALIILLPFHFAHAVSLLMLEIAKYYPNAIYETIKNFYYGKDDKNT